GSVEWARSAFSVQRGVLECVGSAQGVAAVAAEHLLISGEIQVWSVGRAVIAPHPFDVGGLEWPAGVRWARTGRQHRPDRQHQGCGAEGVAHRYVASWELSAAADWLRYCRPPASLGDWFTEPGLAARVSPTADDRMRTGRRWGAEVHARGPGGMSQHCRLRRMRRRYGSRGAMGAAAAASLAVVGVLVSTSAMGDAEEGDSLESVD